MRTHAMLHYSYSKVLCAFKFISTVYLREILAANVKVDVYTEQDRRSFDTFDYSQAVDAFILIGSSLNQIERIVLCRD